MNRYQKLSVQGRGLLLYLPSSYGTSPEARYPVAYVQDGGELFEACLNQLELLFRQGRLPELILVGVESPDRNNDYTPWPAVSLLESYPDFGGHGRAYVDELADIVKLYIDTNYRTLPDAANTAIIGGSFGGLISMFAGYWRPDTFGRLGLLSTSFWYKGVLDYVLEQPALAEHIRIYMSVGDCEGIYKKNAQQNMVPYTKRAHAAWLAKDGDARRIRFELTEGGTHDLYCMATHFPEALAFLFAEGEAGASDRAVKELAYTISGTRQWSMHARRTGREYRIFVYVPSAPPPEQGYPVLYTLDGNASFGSLAEAVRLQGRPPRGFEPCVVVAIGYPSDQPIVSDRRFFDYTEKGDSSKLPARPDGSAWPETGGASEFLAFIEEELKPAVERRFHIDRERQSLFGHSLGGWFALYVLTERPEAFSAYIAGSPSIWWNGSTLLDRLPIALARLPKRAPIALYIGIGSEEKPSMVEEAEQLHLLLQPYEEQGLLRLAYRKFENEGHVSVIHPLISGLLRFIMQKEGATYGVNAAH
ncbi:alpha/beta hydrolase [Paenibacillus sp. 2TAB19]|uniref:alpha/beta hydrolase n=1 Tax=Paenibacillus sp. 2TAB19 TaxID=3233003 RepID=UPI003F9DB81A